MTIEAPHNRRPRRPVGAPLYTGSERIIRPLSAGLVAAGQTTQGIKLNWPQSGRVVAVRAFAYDPTGTLSVEEASARMALQIQVDADHALITNGESGDFAPCLSITPPQAPWFQLDIPVLANRPWLISWQCRASEGFLVGDISFAFRRGETVS